MEDAHRAGEAAAPPSGRIPARRPTNHLDIESIQWLEGYLRDYPGAVVLISHDRAFLDNVTNRTIEISLGKIYDTRPRTAIMWNCAARGESNRWRPTEPAADDREDRGVLSKNSATSTPTKSNQVQSRVKQLEKLERLEVDEEDLSRMNIKFPARAVPAR